VIKFEFFVPGTPIAKQYRQTKFGVIYNKGINVAWEKAIGWAAQVAAGPGYKPVLFPAKVTMTFSFPIAKSRKELKPNDLHLQDPDLDNLQKSCLDGIKRVLFMDDCQVVEIHAKKKWNNDSGVRIEIEEVDQPSAQEGQ
jgi:Holliday junction resolvase RusA-like endonuclease